MASRRVVRLTFSASLSSFSLGSLLPGANRCSSMISSYRRSAVHSDSFSFFLSPCSYLPAERPSPADFRGNALDIIQIIGYNDIIQQIKK